MKKFLRVSDIVGNPAKGKVGLISISKSTWWAWVAAGKCPKPVKFGKRTTCWKGEDIEDFLNNPCNYFE